MIGATQPGALTKQQARLGRTIVLAATGAGKTTTVLSSIFNEELGYYEHYAMVIIISRPDLAFPSSRDAPRVAPGANDPPRWTPRPH